MLKFLMLTAFALSGAFYRAQSNPAPGALTRALLNHGQSKKDTVIESDTSKENKEPRYYYISAYTNFFVNTKGGFAKRLAPAVELGRTYGIFDIGLAAGQFISIHADTARYLEFRPTINIFSKGRFSEALCLGADYLLGARQTLVTEICNSINFKV